MTDCCKLLGAWILFSCSCPYRSGHTVPINLQQDKYSLLCNFLTYTNGKCYTFKVQSLKSGLSSIFQAIGSILFFLSLSVMSDSLRLHGLYSPWNSPGQNTGEGSRSLLQGIFPTQEFKPGSPAPQVDSLPTELPGKPLLTCSKSNIIPRLK